MKQDEDILVSVTIEWRKPTTASMSKAIAEPALWRRKLKEVGEAVMDHAIENGEAEVKIRVTRRDDHSTSKEQK